MKADGPMWVSPTWIWLSLSAHLDSPVTLRLKQNEKKRYRADTRCEHSVGTITVMFNSFLKGATP